jgi:hypothetical protein
MLDMDIKTYIKSPWFKGVITGLCLAVIMLLIFQAGVMVGFRKAMFMSRFGDMYYRGFEGQPGKFIGMFEGDGIASHGAVGKIISVNLPTFVIEGPEQLERIVRVESDTEIRRFRDTASSSDLVSGEFVVVIGEPNDDAEITAKLIRIMPPPPAR